jgi:hypothetical protein
MQSIRAQINQAENDAIADRIRLDWQGRSYTFPMSEAQRAGHPVNLGTALRAEREDSGRTFYYLTGWKDYGPRPYPDCDATVDFDAVIIRDKNGRISSPQTSAYTTFECSRDNGIGLVVAPMATVSWTGPVLWVIRIDAEDGFEYALMNPSAARVSSVIQFKGLWQMRTQE